MTGRSHPFVDRIAQACGDPGSIVGMKAENESVPRWSTRAVLQVLHETPLADQFAALNADRDAKPAP